MRVITIGRSSQNDIVIADTRVSRHHLQIIQDDNGSFRLVDFGSKNGTYVNGQRVYGEMVLSKSDIVRIGTTTLPWMNYFLSSPPPPHQPLQPVYQPPPVIPGDININEKIEYSNVAKKGDDMRVNFDRQVGNQVGSAVGGTLGCLASIIIVVIFIALIAVIAFTCS